MNNDGSVPRRSWRQHSESNDGGFYYNMVINGLDDGLLCLRYVRLCYEIEILETNFCAMGGFMLLGHISLVMAMVNFDQEGTNSPV
jgi:hypothetical protein